MHGRILHAGRLVSSSCTVFCIEATNILDILSAQPEFWNAEGLKYPAWRCVCRPAEGCVPELWSLPEKAKCYFCKKGMLSCTRCL